MESAMSRSLVVTPSRCIGCRTCEVACAFSHPQRARPGRTRIRAFAQKAPEKGIPVVCLQCDAAACVQVCPTGALERDDATGAVMVREDKCVLCRSCVTACPFGNMGWDDAVRKVYKCDLCGGDPECAKYCPSRALEHG